MPTESAIRRTYLLLTLVQTLAASLIYGINTLFLLDAGLSNTGAFVANAAFTAGVVIFEIPTGVVADVVGRRASYLWGTVTLGLSTAAYLWLWAISGPLWAWVVVSALLGLGYTFFSGATEAWLVDALAATEGTSDLEKVFGQAAIVGGAAMLVGSVGGGVLAQFGLGVPYYLRSVLLLVTFFLAWRWMHDIGFEPKRSSGIRREVGKIARASIDQGLRHRPVRLIMLSAPFSFGVGMWAFYAFQPHLLDLYGDPNAAWIAGVAAAVFAGARMVGGFLASFTTRGFSNRSSVLAVAIVIQASGLIVVGLTGSFWIALLALVVTSVSMAAAQPIRQTLLNRLIASGQRATVLSFDGLMASAGGVVVQPALGRTADVWSYGTAYAAGGLVYILSAPFLIGLRRLDLAEDRTTT